MPDILLAIGQAGADAIMHYPVLATILLIIANIGIYGYTATRLATKHKHGRSST